MPRALRGEYEGAIYHILNRGDRREDIFFKEEDPVFFLKTLEQVCRRTGWQVHAYCLMRNHFHLVVETPLPNLVVGMKWMLGTYTQRFNARHRLRGHLFAGRYKALIVDDSDDFYLRTVCDYVHLNPVRARLVRGENPLSSFPWSSFPAYLSAPRKRPGWLMVDRVFGEQGIARDDVRGRREFQRRMEERRRTPDSEDLYTDIRRGWRLGSEDFVDRLRDRMGVAVADRHAPEQVHESMGVRAKQILAEKLRRAGVSPGDLERLPKGAAIKVRIAQRLRESTTLTLKEIASFLSAGNWRSLANALSKAATVGGKIGER